MKPLELSEKSLEDLAGILAFIAQDKPEAAVRFVDRLQHECELLQSFPQIGSLRTDLAAELRLFTFRGYGIYYRELDDRVRIERVLHPSLNVRQQAFE